MPRTQQQTAADTALTRAIEDMLNAYGDEHVPYVLTEYVVVTSQVRYDADGDGVTAVGISFRDSDVPTHRALGLLDYATARIRAVVCQD